MNDQSELEDLRARFSGRLISDPADMEPYLTDWRRKWTGFARGVAQPDTAPDVASVVRWCAARRIPVVPQGGNTGLSGGSTPDASGQSLIVSLARMNRIRSIDHHNSTLTAEAGCILKDAQRAASHAGKFLPLSLAAEGSCTIGGNLATNAGGTAVLRYGNARDLCLGLEVVTPHGEIWDSLHGLRKSNAGYNLRDLFIGSEGTLGIITAAVLRLYPQPRGRATGFLAVDSVEQGCNLLDLARDLLDSRLTAFELMSSACLELVLRHHPAARRPLERQSAWYLLIEVSDSDGFVVAESGLHLLLERALERGLVSDGIVAGSIAQARALWSLRENISESQAREGPTIKHDISLPISELATFIESTGTMIEERWPGSRLVIFGHLGDGNLHYNLSPVVGMNHGEFLALEHQINRLVHDVVNAASGSISAEHGLGVLRRDESARYKSAVELSLMRSIKNSIDPDGIMNPGKVLPSTVPF